MLAVFFRRKRYRRNEQRALGAQNGLLSTGKLDDYSGRGERGQTFRGAGSRWGRRARM